MCLSKILMPMRSKNFFMSLSKWSGYGLKVVGGTNTISVTYGLHLAEKFLIIFAFLKNKPNVFRIQPSVNLKYFLVKYKQTAIGQMLTNANLYQP